MRKTRKENPKKSETICRIRGKLIYKKYPQRDGKIHCTLKTKKQKKTEFYEKITGCISFPLLL